MQRSASWKRSAGGPLTLYTRYFNQLGYCYPTSSRANTRACSPSSAPRPRASTCSWYLSCRHDEHFAMTAPGAAGFRRARATAIASSTGSRARGRRAACARRRTGCASFWPSARAHAASAGCRACSCTTGCGSPIVQRSQRWSPAARRSRRSSRPHASATSSAPTAGRCSSRARPTRTGCARVAAPRCQRTPIVSLVAAAYSRRNQSWRKVAARCSGRP